MNGQVSTGKIKIFGTAALCNAGAEGLQNERAERCVNTDPALATHAFEERAMHLTRITPGVRPGQAPEDPLIAQARFLNEAAELERRLAARRALRPIRSEAARLGWETRRAR